ncbi:MFS transporter [Sphingomonas panacis]|uniref:MFS transporter n=1 Tax=Sphingomonas panacis TaxID=1560345 RepID=UPI0008412044|nr:MFS transporter [Sphingomonas panacis]
MTESNVARAGAAWPRPLVAWTTAILLMMANTLAFVDRQALALLVQPIKADLHVSDTGMSLLYGLSFTLFYVIVGIPVARIADRSNRRNIVVGAVFIWSVATAICGIARSFPALFLARVGVGAGEGGLSPAAYSILADTFPKDRLPVALGIYQMGIYVGGALALVLGGLIATHVPPSAVVALPVIGDVKGWQLIFLLLGIPGILLSIVLLAIREPVRQGSTGETTIVPLPRFFAQLRGRWQAYTGIGVGFALMILVGNATGAWIPAFLERKFGMTTGQIGASYGPLVLVCGVAGTFAGGLFAGFLRRRGFRYANLQAALLGFSALIPVSVAFPLMSTATWALTLIGMMNFFAGFNFGGGLAALQEVTPNRMRALVSSGYMLLVNLIGAAGGPLAIALVTDYWFADPGELPLAIAAVCAIASPLALLFLLLGLKGYAAALATPDADRMSI